MAITNPPLSGDLVDYANTSKFKLTVSGTIVDVTSSSRFNIDSISVSYDGKRLQFTEVPTPHIGNRAYTYDNTVTLDMDLGSGLQRWFTGRIRQIPITGKNNNEKVSYVAVGIQELSDDVIVVDDFGAPSVSYPAYVTTTLNTLTWLGFPVWIGISDLFTDHAATLGAYGIPATIGGTSIQTIFQSVLQKDMQIQNSGFASGLKEMVANEPNKRAFFDDLTQTWLFPNLTDATIEDIQINSVNVMEFNYTLDFSNRATRLTLVAPWNGSQAMFNRKASVLTPTWDSSLQSSWCNQRTFVDSATGQPSDYYWVFRRWSISSGISDRHPTAPTKLYVFFTGVGWIPFRANIDWENNVVVSNRPVVVATGSKGRKNPYHAGHVTAPAAAIVYYDKNSIPTDGWASITHPGSGYEGNCYDLYGMERHKTESTDLAGLTAWNVENRLSLLKDVIVKGTLTIHGDPIPELLNLQKRVRFAHNLNSTGLETIVAIVQSYTYNFGRRGSSQIELTTDLSGLVRVI